MTKFSFVILLGVFISASASGMIQTLQVPELIKTADFILIAKVKEKKQVNEPKAKFPQIKNVLESEKFLKGKLPEDTPLEILTFDSQGEWVEDVITFPEKGERVLLFLKEGKNGNLVPVNGIQGVWPLLPDSDKTLGMGFSYSIEVVEEEIKSQSGK